jgi:hypothetical protein
MMAPWPRKLMNFPIIIIAIIIQYTWSICILLDKTAVNTTSVNILSWFFTRNVLFMILFTCATSSAAAFVFKKKIWTCIALMPQQAMLALSSLGSLIAILNEQFADGVERSRGFLLVDQCPILFLFVAHGWAVMLIYLYGEER